MNQRRGGALLEFASEFPASEPEPAPGREPHRQITIGTWPIAFPRPISGHSRRARADDPGRALKMHLMTVDRGLSLATHGTPAMLWRLAVEVPIDRGVRHQDDPQSRRHVSPALSKPDRHV